MLNYIWLGLMLLAVLIGGFKGEMKEVTDGAVKGAETAVTLSLGLIGIMTLWLGVMRLAERAGLVQIIADLLRPLMRWLFPDVPANHPAMGSMILNFAANMLGLVNAATPLGLRAMKDLETLNKTPGTATNAMVTFLAINTSSIQLLPITAVGLLASAGSKNPTAIIGTAFLATIVSTIVGITAVKTFGKMRVFRMPLPTAPAADLSKPAETVAKSEASASERIEAAPLTRWGRIALGVFSGCFVIFFALLAFPEWFGATIPTEQRGQNGLVRSVHSISLLAVPFLLSFFPLYAALRKLKVYEEFVEGAKEGFNTAVRIIPYLVTILVAVMMFRAAGGIDIITNFLRPVLTVLRFPPELVPMCLMRPLSGSGTFGLFSELVNTLGPDNIISRMAATIYGSTETTFYVITVYFGSVAVRATRHAIPVGLLADFSGMIASVIICWIVFG